MIKIKQNNEKNFSGELKTIHHLGPLNAVDRQQALAGHSTVHGHFLTGVVNLCPVRTSISVGFEETDTINIVSLLEWLLSEGADFKKLKNLSPEAKNAIMNAIAS